MARPIQKREDIERGVIEVVARKGLRGTTIQDIADAASVSPGLLYRYWKNRDDLAADVYRQRYLALLERLGTLAAAPGTVPEKLRALIGAFLRFADDEPVLLRFLLLSQHDLADRVPESAGVHTMARNLIRAGVSEGWLREMDAELAVQLLLGLVLQPVVGATYGHLAHPVSAYADAIYSAVQRTLLVEASQQLSFARNKQD